MKQPETRRNGLLGYLSLSRLAQGESANLTSALPLQSGRLCRQALPFSHLTGSSLHRMSLESRVIL